MATPYLREVVVVNILGIHARPSYMIVNKANALMIEGVFIKKASEPDQKIDPRDIMSLMSMAASQGTEIIVFTENEEMRGAVDALAELIGSGFGEDCGKT